MEIKRTGRGFFQLIEKNYLHEKNELLVGEASAIGDYKDSLDNPGSSYLWVGQSHRLNREQVAELIRHLQCWLDNKRLTVEEEGK